MGAYSYAQHSSEAKTRGKLPMINFVTAHPGRACGVTEHDFIHGLFVNYSERLRGYIRRRVKNEADVSELVQEVYLSVMRRNTAGSLHVAPQSYLYRTAINLIRDQHRRETVRCAQRHVEFQDDVADSRQTDPEELLASEQAAAALAGRHRQAEPEVPARLPAAAGRRAQLPRD